MENTRDLSELIDRLRHTENSVRRDAAAELGNIGNSAIEAAPALIEALEDPSSEVRYHAAQALGQIDDGSTIPALAELIEAALTEQIGIDEDPVVRTAASIALEKIKAARERATIDQLENTEEHIEPGIALEPDAESRTRGMVEGPRGRPLITDSIGYPFKGQNWLLKWIIAAVLSFIPIVNFFVGGYYIRVMKEGIKGNLSALPEWKNWGDMFVYGILGFLAGLIPF